MLQKLAIIITPEGKANKQQNEAILFFIGNQNFSTDLIFRSQQVWGDKKHVSVQLWLTVRYALSYPFRRAARLNYSSPSTTVALEKSQLPTTWQEPELMFRNNGLLHHNGVTAAGLLS